jgi:hypothetical protein
MADNSDALARARRRDSQVKRARAADVLRAMLDTGEAITFAGLARRAGVSVSLLYADKDLAAKVAEARDRQRQAGSDRAWRLPARSLVAEQSLRTDLANAKEQVRQLQEDAVLLRQRPPALSVPRPTSPGGEPPRPCSTSWRIGPPSCSPRTPGCASGCRRWRPSSGRRWIVSKRRASPTAT